MQAAMLLRLSRGAGLTAGARWRLGALPMRARGRPLPQARPTMTASAPARAPAGEPPKDLSLGIKSPVADKLMKALKRPMPQSERTAIVGHLAYIVGLSAYCVSDMLSLRLLALGGSCCGILYHSLQPRPMRLPIAWGSLFICVNMAQIALLLNERRAVTFSDVELDCYERYFQQHGVTPRQFQRLMAQGVWEELEAGQVLTLEGERVHDIILLQGGSAEVLMNHQRVCTLAPGAFVGHTAALMEPSLKGERRAGREESASGLSDTALAAAQEDAATRLARAEHSVELGTLFNELATITFPEQGVPAAAAPAGRSAQASATSASAAPAAAAPVALAAVAADSSASAAPSALPARTAPAAAAAAAATTTTPAPAQAQKRAGPTSKNQAAPAAAVARAEPAQAQQRAGPTSENQAAPAAVAARAARAKPPQGAGQTCSMPAPPASAAAQAATACSSDAMVSGKSEPLTLDAVEGCETIARRTVRTASRVRVLRWNAGQLREFVAKEKTLALPLSKMISNDLMTQITSMERDVFVAAYKEIMRATLTGSRITPEEKRLLREYRARHTIPDEEHQELLRHFGWTREEFEDGALASSLNMGSIGNTLSKWRKKLTRRAEGPAPEPATFSVQ